MLRLEDDQSHSLSSSARLLVIPKETGIFQHSAAKLFNYLPENITETVLSTAISNITKEFQKNKIDT